MKRLSITALTLFFLTSATIRANFADWISAHLPASMQASEEYRDEVIYMKNKMNLQIPIIVVKQNDAPYKAAVRNIDLGISRLAIMFINEKAFHDGYPASNTRTLAHEITHIQNNDHPNLTIQPLAALSALSLAAKKLADSMNAANPARDLLMAIMLITAAERVAHTIPDHSEKEYPSRYEINADKGSFEILRALGYTKALENEIAHNKTAINLYGADYRPRGREYPTCGEYLSWAHQAHAACIGLNPAERPDSQHLMRNGTYPQNNPSSRT